MNEYQFRHRQFVRIVIFGAIGTFSLSKEWIPSLLTIILAISLLKRDVNSVCLNNDLLIMMS